MPELGGFGESVNSSIFVNHGCHLLPCVSSATLIPFACNKSTKRSICGSSAGFPPDMVTWPKQTPPSLINSAKISSAFIFRILCFSRSEEHTSELQSRGHLVCRLLLEKKN